MAKSPSAPAPAAPAAAPAPAPDPAAEDAPAPGGLRLRLQQLVGERLRPLAGRLSQLVARLPIPRIALSRKMLIIILASVFGVSAAGAAAYAFWPAEPESSHQPVVKKTKKKKKPKAGASAPQATAQEASAASTPGATASAAVAMAGTAPARSASEPEETMDRLRRRLGETLAGGGKLDETGSGELRVTSRRPPEAAVAARAGVRRVTRPEGYIEASAVHGAERSPERSLEDNAERTAAPSRRLAVPLGDLHWAYEGAGGPDDWGRLKPEFAKCSTGTRQSPIDIRNGIQVQLDPVQFDYRPSAFRVIDNGHTVQVNVAAGNFIEVMGRRFELQQFHFHRPSEERIDGKQFDMVAHLVHKDAEGHLAVVAVLLERGSAQEVVQAVWNNLPLERGEEQAAQTPIDLKQLLPAERSYFTYMGSLTTPPCSEGVLWMVMKKPVPISPDQINIFARLYPMNARPIQSASGRMIKESN